MRRWPGPGATSARPGGPSCWRPGGWPRRRASTSWWPPPRYWRDRDPAPRLAIAGSGPLAAELTAAAGRYGADLVLLGERDDVPALLAAADIVAVPSRWEARALIVQEALRAGAPVVAAGTGGTPGLTGPDAAILVPPEDAGALAAAILAVLDDPVLAARLSEAARARAAALPSPADAVTAARAVYRDVRSGR